MNIEDLTVSSTDARKQYTATQIMAVLDGAGGSGSARSVMTATYQTNTGPLIVYYTALYTDGTILSPRSPDNVTFANGLYQVLQATTGLTDFIAVWDEGNIDDYASEWIAVDT